MPAVRGFDKPILADLHIEGRLFKFLDHLTISKYIPIGIRRRAAVLRSGIVFIKGRFSGDDLVVQFLCLGLLDSDLLVGERVAAVVDRLKEDVAHLDIILLEIFSHRFVGQTLRRLKRSAVGISIIIEIDRLDLVILFVKRGAYGVGSNLLGAVIPIQVIAQHAQAGIVQIIVAHHINIHTVLSICKVSSYSLPPASSISCWI